MKKMACALMALSLIGCERIDATRTDYSEKQISAAREGEFAFDPDQFGSAFNTAAKFYGQPIRINKVDIRHGAVHNYFQQNFSADISLTAGVSKETGRITSVTVLFAGDSHREALRAVAEIIVMASDPALSQEKIKALVAAMIKEDSEMQDGQFSQRFLNRIRYVLRHDSSIGYWWLATPA